jgi:hypothetical protein
VSTAQVSRHIGISFDMQSEHDRSELVRCVGCHGLYEQPPRADEPAACPDCGEVGWLAPSIPIEESAAAAHA